MIRRAKDVDVRARKRSARTVAPARARLRPARRRVPAGLLVALAVVLAVGVEAFVGAQAMSSYLAGPSRTSSPVSSTAAPYESPYDWTSLDRTNGRFAYVRDGQVVSRLGVDVSENQQLIDWEAVAADGIEFAYIRLGYRGTSEGGLYLDAYFERNLEQARTAGIDCGVYFFSQAASPDEAREEARFVLEHLGGAALQYPVAFDSEEAAAGTGRSRTAGLSDAEMTAIAQAFFSEISAAGYGTMLYGNAQDLGRYDSNLLAASPVWWAEYGMPVPTARLDFTLWQYSNEGSVAGIPTKVDMDIDLSGALG